MNPDLLIGTFARDQDLLEAVRAAKQRGLPIVDAFSPYPVHGMEEAMGLKPSRLGWFCFACGAVGVVAAMVLQYWTMAIDWPINVGGRPFNSWPAFVPVAFELLVLFGGFGVVFAFFGVSRLFPGKQAVLPSAQVSNDRFVLVIEASGAAVDTELVFGLFRAHRAVALESRNGLSTRSETQAAHSVRKVNIALGAMFLIGVLLNWTLGSDPGRPNFEFLPEMARPVPYESFGPHGALPGKMLQQPPPEGTIARGHLPLHYQATPEDAERAGAQLNNPFRPGDKRRQPRGAVVYGNHCALCHGPGGAGDGPVSRRGVPPPPSLLADKAMKMKDGQLFHIITYGQGNMAAYGAQISSEDRWAAILHIRKLQHGKEVGK